MIQGMWRQLSNGTRISVLFACSASLLSSGLISIIWIPVTLNAPTEVSFRPMILSAVLALIVITGFLVTAFVAFKHICIGPRWIGLLLLVVSTIPYLLLRLLTWLLVDLRGIHFG